MLIVWSSLFIVGCGFNDARTERRWRGSGREGLTRSVQRTQFFSLYSVTWHARRNAYVGSISLACRVQSGPVGLLYCPLSLLATAREISVGTRGDTSCVSPPCGQSRCTAWVSNIEKSAGEGEKRRDDPVKMRVRTGGTEDSQAALTPGQMFCTAPKDSWPAITQLCQTFFTYITTS